MRMCSLSLWYCFLVLLFGTAYGTVLWRVQVAQVALNHLKQARDLLPSVPKEARPFLLPAVSPPCQL